MVEKHPLGIPLLPRGRDGWDDSSDEEEADYSARAALSPQVKVCYVRNGSVSRVRLHHLLIVTPLFSHQCWISTSMRRLIMIGVRTR